MLKKNINLNALLRNKIILLFFALLFISAQACSQNSSIEDGNITAEVKSKIMLDRSLANYRINISTHDGLVVVNGHVNSDSDASELIELIQSTPGVKDIDVTNLSITESKQPLQDLFITAKVKGLYIQGKLFGEKDLPSLSIHVETKNGTVYLTGTVSNKKQLEEAIRIAKSVSGVKAVDSRLQLK